MVDDETFKQIDEILGRWEADGGDGTFKEFIRFGLPLARNIANRFLNDPDEAEDVAQDAMIRLYKSRDKLRSEGSPSRLLSTTVRNLAIDVLRKRKLFAKYVEEFSEEEMSTSDPEEFSPSSRIERSEELAAVKACIECLPEIQRVILILRCYEEMGLDEIAKRLELSQSAIKTHLYRARNAIKAKMNRPTFGSPR